MTLLALVAEHPLVALGSSAAAAAEPLDSDPLLLEFNTSISPYSTDRLRMDWPRVQRVASAMAAQRCDLKVYGYLALAGFHSAGDDESPYLPLAAVLHALGDVIELGWARCLPKSDSRRQGQLKWLSEELGALVKTRPPQPAQQPVLLACVSAAERAAELAGTALGLGYPILRELREALKEHERAMPAPIAAIAAAPVPAASPAPPPVVAPPSPVLPAAVVAAPAPIVAPPVSTTPTAAPPASAAPIAAPSASAAPSVSAAPTAPPPVSAAPMAPIAAAQLTREAVEDQLAALVVELASQLRADSLLDPAPYWMLRALRWANHDLLRPERVAEVQANKGRSQIPLPAGHAQLSKDFPRRLATGQPGQCAAVVAECEELFAMSPLWLDLQRWIDSGLQSLGAEPARAAVKDQVALLLRCCPQVTGLRFSDREATPFADAETVRWLAGQHAAGSPDAAASPTRPAADGLPEGLLPGVQFLQQQLAKAPSGARQFELQLQLAELLLQNERSDIAMPIVELLLAAIELHHLATWQPDLCQRAVRLAVVTARAAQLAPARRSALWNRVCQLAPVDALQLGPEELPPS